MLFPLRPPKFPSTFNLYFTYHGTAKHILAGSFSWHGLSAEMTKLQICFSTAPPATWVHMQLFNQCPSRIFPAQHVFSLPLKFYAHWILQIMGLVIENTVACSAWLNENFSKNKPPHSQNTKQPLLSKDVSVSLSKLTSSSHVFWSHRLTFKLLKCLNASIIPHSSLKLSYNRKSTTRNRKIIKI